MSVTGVNLRLYRQRTRTRRPGLTLLANTLPRRARRQKATELVTEREPSMPGDSQI
jgi:hypothetical protein